MTDTILWVCTECEMANDCYCWGDELKPSCPKKLDKAKWRKVKKNEPKAKEPNDIFYV